jgi:hypothetical protein
LQARVVWTDPTNANDLEARFVDESFLSAYFASLDVLKTKFDDAYASALVTYRPDTAKKSEKGCVLVDELYGQLLPQCTRNKASILGSLMRFYVENAKEPYCSVIASNLSHIEQALVDLDV